MALIKWAVPAANLVADTSNFMILPVPIKILQKAMKSTLFCLLKYFHSQVKSNLQNFTSRRWFYFYTQATVKPNIC